jgi:hypothetical protein
MKLMSRKAVTMMSLAVATAGAVSAAFVNAQAAAPAAPAAPAAAAAPTVPPGPAPGANNPAKMSFFVTSTAPGGGDLGGIAGADAHCTTLARAAGSPATKTWRAYLSLAPMGSQQQVDARDRIGKGPWYNAKGAEIAASVDDLHTENPKMSKATILTEKGEVNPGRGDTPNVHDALTGSNALGRLAAPEVNAPRGNEPPTPMPPNMTCNNWTSNDPALVTMQGHIDRQGFVPAATSWNTAHPSRGCSVAGIASTGSKGQFYCFATN